MARQSLSPMKDLNFQETSSTELNIERVGRKRKDAPMTHLKYLRKRTGYTLEMLSEITSISISYLSRLESGSRRLNTDLIRRLSHAFGCDPAELLQEVSHDSHVVTPVEFSKRRRAEPMVRESGMSLYCVSNDSENGLSIKACAPSEWRQRPSELASKSEIIALRAGSYFQPHFSDSSVLYLEPLGCLSPESTILISKEGQIMIKKIWSITPTSLQLCDVADIDLLKNGKANKDILMDIDRGSLDVLYKVVGYSDFDLK